MEKQLHKDVLSHTLRDYNEIRLTAKYGIGTNPDPKDKLSDVGLQKLEGIYQRYIDWYEKVKQTVETTTLREKTVSLYMSYLDITIFNNRLNQLISTKALQVEELYFRDTIQQEVINEPDTQVQTSSLLIPAKVENPVTPAYLYNPSKTSIETITQEPVQSIKSKEKTSVKTYEELIDTDIQSTSIKSYISEQVALFFNNQIHQEVLQQLPKQETVPIEKTPLELTKMTFNDRFYLLIHEAIINKTSLEDIHSMVDHVYRDLMQNTNIPKPVTLVRELDRLYCILSSIANQPTTNTHEHQFMYGKYPYLDLTGYIDLEGIKLP